jgi:hypothetical protein
MKCIICNQESGRTDWKNKTTATVGGKVKTVVACDSHSEAEFKAKVKELEKK